jgi:hypothetical protein
MKSDLFIVISGSVGGDMDSAIEVAGGIATSLREDAITEAHCFPFMNGVCVADRLRPPKLSGISIVFCG